MSRISEIEKSLLDLPASEREQVILKVWDSLVGDADALSDVTIDSEGIKLAISREKEIEENLVSPINKEEFLNRTSGS